jgi:hypothetical protein
MRMANPALEPHKLSSAVLVCGVACAWGALRVRKQQRACLVTAQDFVRPRR